MLQSGLQRLRDFPRPFWLALFVEGTRFTKAKLLGAQEFAASQGLPIPRNVLIPRTKVKKKKSCHFLIWIHLHFADVFFYVFFYILFCQCHLTSAGTDTLFLTLYTVFLRLKMVPSL